VYFSLLYTQKDRVTSRISLHFPESVPQNNFKKTIALLPGSPAALHCPGPNLARKNYTMRLINIYNIPFFLRGLRAETHCTQGKILNPSQKNAISHLILGGKDVILPPMQYEHQICVKRIRELMHEARLDMKNLSKKAHLGETTVRDLLVRSDKGNPRVQTLFNISEALGIYPGYLLGLSEVPGIPSPVALESFTLMQQLSEEQQLETLQILRIKAKAAQPETPPHAAVHFTSSESSAGYTLHEPTRTLKK
jgi:transcriptional regulator with XRE-family HTH domain